MASLEPFPTALTAIHRGGVPPTVGSGPPWLRRRVANGHRQVPAIYSSAPWEVRPSEHCTRVQLLWGSVCSEYGLRRIEGDHVPRSGVTQSLSIFVAEVIVPSGLGGGDLQFVRGR